MQVRLPLLRTLRLESLQSLRLQSPSLYQAQPHSESPVAFVLTLRVSVLPLLFVMQYFVDLKNLTAPHIGPRRPSLLVGQNIIIGLKRAHVF